jgi:hypothetical protein
MKSLNSNPMLIRIHNKEIPFIYFKKSQFFHLIVPGFGFRSLKSAAPGPKNSGGGLAQTSHNIDCVLGSLCYIRPCSI